MTYEGKLNTSNKLVKGTKYFIDPSFKFRFEEWQSCVIIILNTYIQNAANADLRVVKEKSQYLQAMGTNFSITRVFYGSVSVTGFGVIDHIQEEKLQKPTTKPTTVDTD